MRDLRFAWVALAVTLLFLVSQAQTQRPKDSARAASIQTHPVLTPPRFEDIAQQAGLTVAHISSPDKKYIVESMSGGVGLIDCDNDGKLDIITVNGSTVDRYKQGGDLMITLYHQEDSKNGEVKFTDITKSAG